MISQPPLSIFRSFSDPMPHSWSLDQRIKSVSTAVLLSLHKQVKSAHAPCFTPRITHFLTINPSQIYCQVIIYMEASQFGADPHFSNFTTPQIGRGQVFQKGKAAAPLRSVIGEPLLAFRFCSLLDNKVIAVKICIKWLKHSQSGQQQQNGTTQTENKLDICKQEREKKCSWKPSLEKRRSCKICLGCFTRQPPQLSMWTIFSILKNILFGQWKLLCTTQHFIGGKSPLESQNL